MHLKNSLLDALPEICVPTPMIPATDPKIICWSEDAASLIDLKKNDSSFKDYFSGNQLFEHSKPLSTVYGGHQFGHWAGQLGDGRAHIIGDYNGYEIQIKGAGPTPFSRRGDGLAVLRSSVREFLSSEALHHLNIPTTRALCCIKTEDKVLRDLFYDGHPEYESRGLTTRLSKSFIRFGHFQILTANNDVSTLKKLSDYCHKNFYKDSTDIYDMFKSICEKTAVLMTEWMRIGFVHGVMNTDNMSILGQTIDYGPYGFLDEYDPQFTPNTTDFSHRRYRYENQPQIALWNLQRLAEALLPIAPDKNKLIDGFKTYEHTYQQSMLSILKKKFGLSTIDSEFIEDTYKFMFENKLDYTLFFRHLSHFAFQDISENDFIQALSESSYLGELNRTDIQPWLNSYKDRLDQSPEISSMKSVNPVFILRNYLSQQVITELDNNQFDLYEKIMGVLKTPYDYNTLTSAFFIKSPAWSKDKPGCAYLSCSS